MIFLNDQGQFEKPEAFLPLSAGEILRSGTSCTQAETRDFIHLNLREM